MTPPAPRTAAPSRTGSACRAWRGAARRVALLAAALLLPGCAIRDQTVGQALPAGLATLRTGSTTKAQALAVLGAPTSVRRQFDGDLLFWRRDALHSETLLLVPLIPIYERTRGHASSDVLTLLFDHSGVLIGIGEQRDIP